MHDDTLHFAYAADAPSLDTFDVKAVTPAELLGSPAALTVIGESHYVGLPTRDYHEMCSCRPLSAETAYNVPLERGVEQSLTFENDALAAETDVAVRRIEAFPGPEATTVSYRFGPDAWTTIAVGEPSADDAPTAVGEPSAGGRPSAGGESPPANPRKRATYETYHTYPEFEIAVYTETRLTVKPGALPDNSDLITSTNDD